MATLNGATALGIGERTGNLQVGKVWFLYTFTGRALSSFYPSLPI